MTMVELKPGFSIRHDMVDKIKLCPICKGNWQKWSWWQPYAPWNSYPMFGTHIGNCGHCYGGVVYTKKYFEDKHKK